jgi:hypothetical protein
VEFALEQLTVRKTMAATMTMFAAAALAVAVSLSPVHRARSVASGPALQTLTAAVPGLAPFQDVRLGAFDVVGPSSGPEATRTAPGAPPAIPRELLDGSPGSVPVTAAAYGWGRGQIRDLVATTFGRIAGAAQVPRALCVAHRESRFHILVTNRSSGAAGLFQWLPHSWLVYSQRYGLAGASPYDAVANVTVAAHVVADAGWGPWAGPGC